MLDGCATVWEDVECGGGTMTGGCSELSIFSNVPKLPQQDSPLSEMLASSPMVLSPEGTSVALAGGLSVNPGTFFGQPAGTERRVSTSSAGVSDFFAA